MNRDQKAVAIEEIAANIDQSEAIFAVDYRGITVEQVAELRTKLREADATFKVVKNSLTERAADQVGAETLKSYLTGPTALTFVRGDVAVAAKAVADYGRAIQLLPFKGGLMGGEELQVEQIRSLSRLPSRDVLYGQLVGIVASPVSGLVRSLNALISGLAIALGQVNEKKESGEIPAGEPPEAEAAPEAEAEAAPGAPEAEAAAAEAEAAPEEEKEEERKAEPEAEAAPEEPEGEKEEEKKAEPDADEPAKDEIQADVSAEAEGDDAETKPTKED
ncbi:MAG TPA: 50S ribosomal protein L10 [Solirubrobacteraceae bacterium]